MRNILAAICISTLASCGGTSVPMTLSGSDTASSTALFSTQPTVPVLASSIDDASFGSLLNNVRVKNGAGAVTLNAQLDAAAQMHAQDMLDNGYFAHEGLDGSSAGDRITMAGYDWRTYGENIARDYRTSEGVMTGWTNSQGHHENNVNPNFEEYGLGYAQDGSGTRWVLLLGAR